tara:strand:- start:704 stop:1285 length:582 start_codon:yes stop_codon:yes gene_type:complete
MKTVYLDPGHGGADPGALGPSGIRESDMALDVCLRTKKLLDPYVNCFLTRPDDRFLTLSQRPAIANKGEADAFLSYHFNAAESPNTASSWEIFTTRGQNRSDKLATAIGLEHAKQFPDQRQRQDWSDGDLDKEAGFAVIRGTDHPSCLMEGEFIHTTHGETLIKNPKNRQKMAVAAATGILNFLGVTPTTCKC